MANRTIYVKPEAEAMYARAQELAAEQGVSLSDVISGLLALHVWAVDGRPTGPGQIDRARQAFAALDEEADCDRCDRPGRVRLTIDLADAGRPMMIERLCPDHAAEFPLDAR